MATPIRPILALYLADIRRGEPLSRDEERHIGVRARGGCEESVRRLVEASLPFVIQIARRYAHLGIPLEDLLGEGNLGLLEAARRFNPDAGTRFTTYASWWVRKSIIDALHRQSNPVRVPVYQREKLRRLREQQTDLEQSLGRAPLAEELSERLSMSLQQVEQTRQSIAYGVSLDQPIGKGTTLRDILPDATAGDPEDALGRQQLTEGLARALETLDGREREVIDLRYGLTGGEPMTLMQLGERMALSRERVRQLEQRALARVARYFLRRRAITAVSARVLSRGTNH